MRVTNQMMVQSAVNNISANTNRMMELQETLSSGKRIQKPSDNPIEAGRLIGYHEQLDRVEQFERNIRYAESWLRTSESAMDSIGTHLQRAKSLAVSQSTETSSPETRAAVAEEVEAIYQEMFRLANTQLGDSHVFAGHKTSSQAYTTNADGVEGTEDDASASYLGNDGEISVLIGEGMTLGISFSGEEVFEADGAEIFTTLEDLKAALQADDTEGISAQVEKLGNALNTINAMRAKAGAKLNRLESTTQFWSEFKATMTEVVSETEDADLADVFARLTSQETAYQASLASAARLFQQSILDYV